MATMELTHDSKAVVSIASTALGWIALVSADGVIRQLTFGHPSKADALRALHARLGGKAHIGRQQDPVVSRLQAYAEGIPVDFSDVTVDSGPLTDFQTRVIRLCRSIPYGKTLTYGQLAAQAGFPRAARAVGNCMAANRVPLIIPCHRVIPASGHYGAFSAPGGSAMKQRLLMLETNQF